MRFETLAELEAFLAGMADLPGEVRGLSALDHGLQCAGILQDLAPDDAELQIAGLVHDIGETSSQAHDHGLVGATAVRALLGERVAEAARLHVDAKRYLVTTDPAYRAGLSPVSVASLALQGGDMSDEEARIFWLGLHGADAVLLRRADDLAKAPGLATAQLEAWLPVLRQVAERAR